MEDVCPTERTGHDHVHGYGAGFFRSCVGHALLFSGVGHALLFNALLQWGRGGEAPAVWSVRPP